MSASDRHYPFAAVVGQDDAKLALQLLAIDPRIGGVLLRGEKGSAKTTLARGVADLLPGEASFVDLPLGATEDRLLGTLDLAAMLSGGEARFTPGLLARAHGGVLYVDEINLLADHLVDTLLDVTVSGVNHVERDGVSHRHDARFVLIGSMNPEEGELRPQLLDRFGLSVMVTASTDPAERAEAVRRRLGFDAADAAALPDSSAETERLRQQLAGATVATVPDALTETASRLALAVGAEGLRADIVLCRAAAAHAGLHGRRVADERDLRRVAPLVLAHRSRRNPFDPPVLPPDALDDAIDETVPADGPPPSKPESPSEPDADVTSEPSQGSDGDGGVRGQATTTAMAQGEQRRPESRATSPSSAVSDAVAGRRAMTESATGRLVRDVAFDPDSTRSIAVAASVRQLGTRRQHDPDAAMEVGDLRHAVRERPSGALIVLVVDTSGSMGAVQRAELASGTALGLLADAYERRDHVALVTFGGDGADVVLGPTGSVEVARNRLSSLETGGATPLGAGLEQALELTRRRVDATRTPFVVLISDGRASGTADAVDRAMNAAGELARAGVPGLVLDCETNVPRLGLASRLAEAMASPCVRAADLDAQTASATIRSLSQEALDAR